MTGSSTCSAASTSCRPSATPRPSLPTSRGTSMTLRERLVAWLSDAFTRAALIAAPKPKVPLTRRFMVEVSDPNYLSDLTVELLFVPQSEMPAAEWHVITITQYPGEKPLLLDSAVGRCYVWHLQETTDIETLVKVFQPDYRATVHCPSM